MNGKDVPAEGIPVGIFPGELHISAVEFIEQNGMRCTVLTRREVRASCLRSSISYRVECLHQRGLVNRNPVLPASLNT